MLPIGRGGMGAVCQVSRWVRSTALDLLVPVRVAEAVRGWGPRAGAGPAAAGGPPSGAVRGSKSALSGGACPGKVAGDATGGGDAFGWVCEGVASAGAPAGCEPWLVDASGCTGNRFGASAGTLQHTALSYSMHVRARA